MTGRLAIAADLIEAADVDGASWWQKSAHHLAVDAGALTHLHTAFDDLDARDFNSVYLLTGGGPAISPTCWRRLAFAISGSTSSVWRCLIVCALPFVLPLIYFLMKRLSR